jgi:hypothetical protein
LSFDSQGNSRRLRYDRATPIPSALTMEDYQYECTSPEADELARVIADLFPEQTRFVERIDAGTHWLAVHWMGLRFSAAPRRMSLDIRLPAPVWSRYAALAPLARARSHAVLRAYVEAWIGSIEERHASGEAVERDNELELDETFA